MDEEESEEEQEMEGEYEDEEEDRDGYNVEYIEVMRCVCFAK